MEDVLAVQVVDSYADLDEELPNTILAQVLVLIVLPSEFLQVLIQILVLTELHDDVDSLFI